jgi:hypothetical protein
MKSQKMTLRSALALVALTVTLLMAGVSSSYADGYYRHNQNGYWDNHHAYHHYNYYHGHQGYWYPQPNGVRIWINI